MLDHFHGNDLDDMPTADQVVSEPGRWAGTWGPVDIERVIARRALAPATQQKYKRALQRCLAAGAQLDDPEALAEYGASLPRSSRAALKAAIGHILAEFERAAKSGATSANMPEVQAALLRAEAVADAIRVPKTRGRRRGIWLTVEEVARLQASCQDDVRGQRDHLALALQVGAGLRRSEAAQLRFEALRRWPVGASSRAVLTVQGKGARRRSVPISETLATAIEDWAGRCGGRGRILRSVGRDDQIGVSLSGQAIADIVATYGARLGRPELRPHDLRRTYAQIGFEAGIPITQISILLGHASVLTTQKYLDLSLDLQETISDYVPV